MIKSSDQVSQNDEKWGTNVVGKRSHLQDLHQINLQKETTWAEHSTEVCCGLKVCLINKPVWVATTTSP